MASAAASRNVAGHIWPCSTAASRELFGRPPRPPPQQPGSRSVSRRSRACGTATSRRVVSGRRACIGRSRLHGTLTPAGVSLYRRLRPAGAFDARRRDRSRYDLPLSRGSDFRARGRRADWPARLAERRGAAVAVRCDGDGHSSARPTTPRCSPSRGKTAFVTAPAEACVEQPNWPCGPFEAAGLELSEERLR